MNELTFGQRVKLTREAKGWSLRRLAEEISTSPGYISLIENGLRPTVGAELLVGLSRSLEVTTDWLLGLTANQRAVRIDYTNWRNERAIREIVPITIWFGATEWHPEPQWLLDAWDCAKGQRRTFAMSSVHSWEAAL